MFPDSFFNAHNDHEGDPAVSPVAAISQYINKVSFIVLDHYHRLCTYVSVTIPIEHFNKTYIIINEDLYTLTVPGIQFTTALMMSLPMDATAGHLMGNST